MTKTCRGLVIAGVHSGVGKTTVALGLLAAFKRRGLVVQPFKVGPDFIDPGHHSLAAGRPAVNLDGGMLDRQTNLAMFRRHCQDADLALVEGVMGLFDGYDGASEAGSTAQMAKWLDLPVVLVVAGRSMARSVAALVHGFATFDPDLPLAGVILNQVSSPRHLEYLQQALLQVPGVTCFGGLPRQETLAIPERHLGLVTAQERPLTEEFLAALADCLESHLNLDALWQALPTLPPNPGPKEAEPNPVRVRLGVAHDEAFCFYYPENFRLLRWAGAELVPFSPLRESTLPPNLNGLYLGGGYPEVFARELADNAPLLRAIRERAQAGLPIYAECGGLMYLSQGLTTLTGERLDLAGVLPFEVRMLPRLKALGYREITLTQASLLGPPGTQARGHEFHYSEIVGGTETVATSYHLTGRGGVVGGPEGFCRYRTLASYVHLHFGSNPLVARHFIDYCYRYKETL
ncbi:MAG: cobyrinate a,c-diamide synthase [Desulfobacca sp.]|uniref:cobyrinate a,c-diamide synthase n=1 Tax=Desulfobacca sp. TaxID=2067990 RepID=UPI00404AAA96